MNATVKITDERLAEILHFCGVNDDSWDVSNSEMLSLATEIQSLRSQPAGVRVKGLEWEGQTAIDAFGLRWTVYMDYGREDGKECFACNCISGTWPTVEEAKAAAEADYRQRILSALEPQQEEAPQCCMCGKKELSTIEGDGGTECQLEDGRWTCSEPCFEKAGGYGPEYAGPAALEPQQEEAEPVAWECYWPGAGSVNSLTRLTRFARDVERAKAEGAEITPLYAHPTPAQKVQQSQTVSGGMFEMRQRVTKTKGSSWTGRVVGFYSTELTPIGYAVESENEPGSVQIYPEAALSPKTQ